MRLGLTSGSRPVLRWASFWGHSSSHSSLNYSDSLTIRGREHGSEGPVFLFSMCVRHWYSYVYSHFYLFTRVFEFNISSEIPAHAVVQLHSSLEKVMESRLRIEVTSWGGSFLLLLLVLLTLFSLFFWSILQPPHYYVIHNGAYVLTMFMLYELVSLAFPFGKGVDWIIEFFKW